MKNTLKSNHNHTLKHTSPPVTFHIILKKINIVVSVPVKVQAY
jgi:hypothetical protein